MVKEITMPALRNYESEFFYNDSNTVVFVCPVNGKTTPGSTYPRCELRQMKPNGDPAAWSNKTAQWSMACVLQFLELPGGKDHVVGMQVHDSNDDVTVLRKEGSDLWVTKGDNTHHVKVASGVGPSTVLNMQVTASQGGGFNWFRDGTLVAHVGGTRSGCYFKAGCYPQANSSSGSGRGVVKIHSLRIWKG